MSAYVASFVISCCMDLGPLSEGSLFRKSIIPTKPNPSPNLNPKP